MTFSAPQYSDTVGEGHQRFDRREPFSLTLCGGGDFLTQSKTMVPR